MNYYQNKLVWITGASSGIGEHLAYELAKRGARLALSARRSELLATVCQNINKANPAAWSFPTDVLKQDSLSQTQQQILKQLGPIDIVVANAGSHIESKPEEFNAQEYLYIMDLNFGGVIRTVQAALPDFIKRRQGQVVVVSSLAGYRGLPSAAAYGASKAALTHFYESSRFHLQPLGIDVKIISPGFVRTPLTDKNKFSMPFLVEPEKAACIIANGIASKQNEVAFPFVFSRFMKFMQMLPSPIYNYFVSKRWQAMLAKQATPGAFSK